MCAEFSIYLKPDLTAKITTTAQHNYDETIGYCSIKRGHGSKRKGAPQVRGACAATETLVEWKHVVVAAVAANRKTSVTSVPMLRTRPVQLATRRAPTIQWSIAYPYNVVSSSGLLWSRVKVPQQQHKHGR